MTNQGPVNATPPRSKGLSIIAAGVMLLAVFSVYYLPGMFSASGALLGLDYENLHHRRIEFAQQALKERHVLPAWYPRELMGTPFWSNIQSFPFIPSRLPLLLLDAAIGMSAGTMIAALLSALFTFAFCREVGLGRAASAAAGFSFACCGYFASRVLAGHLPLLEAYPSLPLLLWVIERAAALQADDRRIAGRLIIVALCQCAIMLAGHPQLPVYATIVAGFYALYRARRRGLLIVLSMGLGSGLAMFSLWPMGQLIGRSTRLLALDRASNDLPFPYARLLAYVLPWAQGWPPSVPRRPERALSLGADQYFWDTVVYIGWLPLVALAATLLLILLRRKLPNRPWGFLFCAGAAALVLALPDVQGLISRLPGTILRSAARQLYVTGFFLSFSLAAAIEAATAAASADGRRRRRSSLAWSAIGLALLAHYLDLRAHDRNFLRPVPARIDALNEDAVAQMVGDGRAAIDVTLWVPLNRRVDDIGFFDSIMLARSYRGLLDLAQLPPRLNIQDLNGSTLPLRALRATGVKVIVTRLNPRQDLPDLGGSSGLHVYLVPDPLERATFIAESGAMTMPPEAIHQRLRDGPINLADRILLPEDSVAGQPSVTQSTPSTSPATAPARAAGRVRYERPSSDEIELEVESDRPGWVRVLETFDRGWSARVDGVAAPIVPAEEMFLAVQVPPGAHRVILRYHTPGAIAGMVMSAGSLVLLGALWLILWTRGQRGSDADRTGEPA